MERRFGRARFKRVDFPLNAPISDRRQFVEELSRRLPDRLAGAKIREIRSFDGLKIVLVDVAWVLLRPSGTEPVVRVMVEGADAGAVERHARELAGVVREALSA